MKPTVKISEWALAKHPYKGELVLVGRLVEDHYRSDNVEHLIASHRVVTSKVMFSDPEFVETMNTRYELVGPERLETVQDLRKEKGIPLEPA